MARRKRVAGRPGAGGVLAVGAVLVAASTVTSSGASSAPDSVVAQPVPVAAEPRIPVDTRGAGGNTPPTAERPAVLPAVRRTEGQIVQARTGTVGIPAALAAAYRGAAQQTTVDSPGCHLGMELLAAVGKVESGHARDGEVWADGTTQRPILGPVLDGTGPFARIADTDGGTLDGDPVWDRAVGPMQFIPGTWARWRADGNLDGRADPHNVHDASLAAARYLCAGGRDLATPDGLDQAILSYNNSASYLSLVRSWKAAYESGAVTVDLPTVLAAPAPPAISPEPPVTTPPPAPKPPAPTPPATEPPVSQPPATQPPAPGPPATEPPVVGPPPVGEPEPGQGLLCGLLGGLGGLLGLGRPC